MSATFFLEALEEKDPEGYGLVTAGLIEPKKHDFASMSPIVRHVNQKRTNNIIQTMIGQEEMLTAIMLLAIFLPMFFEYFFPAQAEIPGAVSTLFSINSVLLNTALSARLLSEKGMFVLRGFTTLASEISKKPKSILFILGNAIRENFLPYAFTKEGVKIIEGKYRTSSPCKKKAGYFFEFLLRPIFLTAFKGMGWMSSLCLSVMFYENSKNACVTSVAEKAWLNYLFGSVGYCFKKTATTLNSLTIPINTPLYAQDYIAMVDKMFGLKKPKKQIENKCHVARSIFDSTIGAGYHFASYKEKIKFIRDNLGEARTNALAQRVQDILNEDAVPDAEEGSALISSKTDQYEKKLDAIDSACDEIINQYFAEKAGRISKGAIYKGIALLLMVFSIVTSVYYCLGASRLLVEAAQETELGFWQFTADFLRGIGAETQWKAVAFSWLSVGYFSTIHSTKGFMETTNLGIKTSYSKNNWAIFQGVLTIVFMWALAATSSATTAFEANSSGVDVKTIFGGIKGGSVNMVGAIYPARFLAWSTTRIFQKVCGSKEVEEPAIENGASNEGKLTA